METAVLTNIFVKAKVLVLEYLPFQYMYGCAEHSAAAIYSLTVTIVDLYAVVQAGNRRTPPLLIYVVNVIIEP